MCFSVNGEVNFVSKRRYIHAATVPDWYPEWYWKNGLHDARIIGKKTVMLSPTDSKRTGKWTYVELKIDAEGALMNSKVRALRFYNCKEITKGVDIADWWWQSDSLSQKDETYVLHVNLVRHPDCKEYCISFSSCEIVF